MMKEEGEGERGGGSSWHHFSPLAASFSPCVSRESSLTYLTNSFNSLEMVLLLPRLLI